MRKKRAWYCPVGAAQGFRRIQLKIIFVIVTFRERLLFNYLRRRERIVRKYDSSRIIAYVIIKDGPILSLIIIYTLSTARFFFTFVFVTSLFLTKPLVYNSIARIGKQYARVVTGAVFNVLLRSKSAFYTKRACTYKSPQYHSARLPPLFAFYREAIIKRPSRMHYFYIRNNVNGEMFRVRYIYLKFQSPNDISLYVKIRLQLPCTI